MARVFPPLPEHPVNAPWSPNTYYAHKIMADTFRHASTILLQDADANRLKFHAEALTSDILPILEALEEHAQEENFPLPWLYSCTEAVGRLIFDLCKAQEVSGTRFVSANFQVAIH